MAGGAVFERCWPGFGLEEGGGTREYHPVEAGCCAAVRHVVVRQQSSEACVVLASGKLEVAFARQCGWVQRKCFAALT